MIDISKLTVAGARKALDKKEFSALELTDAYLENIEKKDKDIHAYLEVWADTARAQAKAADARIAKKDTQPLTGIPVAVKDIILVKGKKATAASKMLEHYHASYDSTVVKKLKEQGAVLLGRTNMDEFALGASTEFSAFGPTKNPHDMSRVPGGTSGGSAAAVAADTALVALGTDTGGSIRQPSALCGVVGLRPTYGAVSRFGVIAAASSLDQVGTMGKTVEDVRASFDAIRGQDPNDGTSLPESFFKKDIPLKKVIGVPRAFLKQGSDPDVLAAFEKTLEKLKKQGYLIKDIDMPNVPHSLAVYYIINPAEVSTNLARYDGIRYGHSVAADAIGEVYAKSRAAFGPEVRRRILMGTFVLSSGYADAYYRKARAVRGLIRQDFTKAFESVDVVALPTSPTPAFKFGEKADDPLAMYAADIFTVPVNLAGVPAISVPMGAVEREGKKLPTGFQIIASHGAEETLFAIGKDIEAK